MSATMLKVLVIHPSDDLIKSVTIVNSQNKKAGPFDFALFIGDVFTKDHINLDELEPDIPIYFTQAKDESINLSKLHSNFTYLGDIGIYQLHNGLKIGFVGDCTKKYPEEDIIKVFKDQTLDIVLSKLWPDAIAKEEKLLLSADQRLDVILDSKPQYWFACGNGKGLYFKREPYSIDGRVTNFISLAEMGSGRFWYALSISKTPKVVSEPVGKRPIADSGSSKRPLDGSTNSNSKKKSQQMNTPFEVLPESCFLCLSNPNFELHMVVAVAKTCFISITKGPLPTRSKDGFSGHGMIVPIEHFPTLRALVYSKDSNGKVQESDVYLELHQIQLSLVAMFRSLGNNSTVFWEISRKRSVHAHLQFLPVPDSLISAFQKTLDSQIEYMKRLGSESIEYIKFSQNDDLDELYETINSQDYVLFTIYEKNTVTKYLIKLGTDENKFFDAQFPRKVIAVLLDLKNRIHWSKCKQTRDVESAEKAAFKSAYEKFDIMRQQ
ncbi:hypothetical protein CANINC_000961 [Pichia inconspicua]|uniref:Cwf19-like C-terminal domain-containing protein n=1 Tax=Pichia inconspicua TaxID=52247 RepID=A0A4V4NG35_9ASCO|nr:hypothetical protein CANINC_000961 [[Candida] inconspicua]